MSDLVVVGQDPAFGGGAAAMTTAFFDLARLIGREPTLAYVPHPSFHDGRAALLDRIEPLRIMRGTARLVPDLAAAEDRCVVAALATHGYAALRSGRPYISWIATSVRDENFGRASGLSSSRRLAMHVNAPVLRRMERAVLRGSTKVFGISGASRASLARAGGLAEENVGVLPIPVDTDRFGPEPDNEWLERLDRPVLAFVGRGDDPRKNVELALRALPLVRKRIPGATLELIGRPPVGRLPDGATALGEVPSIAEPLRRAAILILPSRQEGFGLVAAEALASGVAVVGTPSGGPEELLRESGGGVVLGGWAAEELAETVIDVLNDRERLLDMRVRGREFVRRVHDPAAIAEQLRRGLDE